jgi:tetratricopeptide (TPR) repeat protein
MRILFQKLGCSLVALALVPGVLTGCKKAPVAKEPVAREDQQADNTPAPQVSPSPLANGQSDAARPKIQAAVQAQLARNYEEAIRLFEEAAALNPKATGIDYQIAVCQMSLGKVEEAKKAAYRSIARNESAAPAYNLIGVMAGRERKYAEAEWAFTKAAQAAPADPMAFYDWSEALRAQGKFAEATQKLRDAVQRNPGEPLYALKLRLVRIESGDAEALIPDVDRELALKPPSADWLMTAAAVALKYGRYKDAARLLDSARQTMQPALFLGLIQEDPFFRQFKQTPEIAPFHDVTISIGTPTPAP